MYDKIAGQAISSETGSRTHNAGHWGVDTPIVGKLDLVGAKMVTLYTEKSVIHNWQAANNRFERG
jgi:hypothetical protein